MPLTVIQVKNAKPKAKVYRLYDANGLYIEVGKSGGKYWRFKYRFAGKENRMSLGIFPTVSLKEARIARNQAKLLLHKGIDPNAERKAKKQHDIEIYENQFQTIAHEWHVKKYKNLNPSYAKRVWRALEKDVFPFVGKLPITKIDGPTLHKCLDKIEQRGAHETAHRTLQICGRIYAYANACGYCTHDPTRGLKTVLAPAKSQHFPAITDPSRLADLLRAIESYDSLITRSALFVGAYTFVRPGNLRRAEWQEINLEDKTWKIPAEKMKLRKPHIVPLAKQVIRIFEELKPLTQKSDYIFPSTRTFKRPMSEGTINAALRRMGYNKNEMTGHGFRHIASTLLNEQGVWNPDAIERQLAHTDRSKIRATYDHSKHLPERRKMMQAWADYLDGLRREDNIVSFKELKMASS